MIRNTIPLIISSDFNYKAKTKLDVVTSGKYSLATCYIGDSAILLVQI